MRFQGGFQSTKAQPGVGLESSHVCHPSSLYGQARGVSQLPMKLAKRLRCWSNMILGDDGNGHSMSTGFVIEKLTLLSTWISGGLVKGDALILLEQYVGQADCSTI